MVNEAARRSDRVAPIASILLMVAILSPVAAAARAEAIPAGWQVVRYAGVTFLAPGSWAVVDLGSDPTGCARLDVAAVYLGSQGPLADCPAHAIGRADAVEVIRLDGPVVGASTRIGTQRAVVAPSSPISRSLSVAFPRLGVRVIGSFATTRAVIRRVIGSFAAGTDAVAHPPQLPRSPAPPTPAVVPVPSAPRLPLRAASPVSPRPTASAFVGRGFDACTAPPLASMRSWLASPYRAIGIYVGGANRACTQAQLTAGWVAAAEHMGWNLEPLYVGLQAPCARQHGMAPVRRDRAAAQGTASADDAVAQAAALGLGVGTPIYFDMEGYDITRTICVHTVNRFLEAWNARLHRRGYVAGVYGGSSSTITALVRAAGTAGFTEPDDIWFANWDGRARVYGDPYFTDAMWIEHHRIHQYRGGHRETYGGATINIDSSQVDGAVVGHPADGSFVHTVRGGMFRIAGGAPMPVHRCDALGGCHPVETLVSVVELPHYPVEGTVIRSAGPGRDYVVAGGAALPVSDCSAVLQRCADPVKVEGSTIHHRAAGHLRSMPPVGTVVRGMPSFVPAVIRYGCTDPIPQGQTVSGVARLPDADLRTLFPACGGTLVFGSGSRAHHRITTMLADGSHRRSLRGTGGDDTAPALSSDGTRIAFAATRAGNTDVWEMRTDGTGLRRLTFAKGIDTAPAWSPDGRTLAFQSARGGSADIWTIGVNGGGLHRLTSLRAFDGTPAWSPDGRTIAFASDRGGGLDVWTIGVHGAGLRRLTFGNGAAPAWSPDGRTIAFQSRRGGAQEIWAIGPAGGGLRRVTSLGNGATSPAWSPDGRRLAFVAAAPRGTRIDVVRRDGWGVTPFPSGPAGAPSWA